MMRLQGELRMWVVRATGNRRQSRGPPQVKTWHWHPQTHCGPGGTPSEVGTGMHLYTPTKPKKRKRSLLGLAYTVYIHIKKMYLLRIHYHEFIIIWVWFSRLPLSNEETPRWQIGIKNVPSRSATDKNLTIRAHHSKLQNTQRKNPPCQQK